jgi:hypothetical protein
MNWKQKICLWIGLVLLVLTAVLVLFLRACYVPNWPTRTDLAFVFIVAVMANVVVVVVQRKCKDK